MKPGNKQRAISLGKPVCEDRPDNGFKEDLKTERE
jgi:hypothetical protein